jgi:cyclopropane-fatty-acyl-phospholipid synthase
LTAIGEIKMEVFTEKEKNLRYFWDRWIRKSKFSSNQNRELWNSRAQEWSIDEEKEGQRAKRRSARINKVIEGLKMRGALCEGINVLDIGCGSGEAIELFAQNGVKSVMGMDISENMLKSCKNRIEKTDFSGNVDFLVCDFENLDISNLNIEKKFDLVFTSMNPVLRRPGGLLKAMALCRKYCFNCGQEHNDDILFTQMKREVLGIEEDEIEHESSNYLLFNILCLMGYYPEIWFFYVESKGKNAVDRKFVELYTKDKLHEELSSSDIDKVYEYLKTKSDKNNILHWEECRTYSCILWDVSKKR